MALGRLELLERFEFFSLDDRTEIASLCIHYLPLLKVICEVSDQPSFGKRETFFHHNLMFSTKVLQLEHYRYGIIKPEMRDRTDQNQ
jgi:hypothetical protein